MKEISVSELKDSIDAKDMVFVLDVRESEELDFGTIPTHHWVPMGEVEERLNEIPEDKKIVVYCRSGGRSSQVVLLLEEKGYKDVWNLSGGILEWGEIDSSITPY